MLRLILGFVLMFQMAHAKDKYFIQLGSFKQLNVLEKSIAKLPNTLRSHVVIIRSSNWYIPFAYYTDSKNVLHAEVPKYKRYFPDAYINHSSNMMQYPMVRNYTQASTVKRTVAPPPPVVKPKVVIRPKPVVQKPMERYQNVAISEEDNTLNLPVRAVVAPKVQVAEAKRIPTPTVTNVVHKKYKHFSKKMLSGHFYYLAYKSTNDSPNLLIKVSFGNHRVTYQPVMGDMTMTQANYLVENNRLYMFADSFTKDGAYSILDEHRTDHFLVSSWTNGKKLNTLRYYYRLNDAKEYLGLETSKGLATTLEEGSFDEFFLEE
ncbi:hypothetical protein KKC13_03815 [bacterium]|nr:hypothetical protein [bacterium]MBU1957287.1 hypothetical protein [bacterium]